MINNCDKCREMMMGLLDNELSTEEAVNINDHLGRCRNCAKEFEEIKESSAALRGLKYEESPDARLDRIWKSPYSRLAKVSGLLMVIVSWIILAGYSLLEMFREGGVETIPKVTIAILSAGVIILLITVIRDRVKTYKKDPYKEVDR